VRPLARRLWLYGLAAPLAVAAAGGALWKAPPDADTLAASARFELRLGLLDEAERHTREALEQDPDHLEALLVEGACAEFRGERERARALYDRALPSVEDPDLAAEIRVALALIHVDAGRLSEADAALQGASPATPGVAAKASYARALRRRAGGDREGAVQACSRALQAAGQDFPLRAGIAGILADLGEGEGAFEALAPGVEAGDPASIYAAARLKFVGGDAETGATLLRRASAGARAWIRRRMQQDASFWQPYRASGVLPADVTGLSPERDTAEENASGGRND